MKSKAIEDSPNDFLGRKTMLMSTGSVLYDNVLCYLVVHLKSSPSLLKHEIEMNLDLFINNNLLSYFQRVDSHFHANVLSLGLFKTVSKASRNSRKDCQCCST